MVALKAVGLGLLHVVMVVRPPLPGVLPWVAAPRVVVLGLLPRLLVEELQPPRPWVLP